MNSQHIPVLSKRELRLRESANRNRVSYVMTILRSPWHKTANAIFLACRPAWFSRAAVSAQRLRAQAAFILLDLLSQREAYEFAPAGEVRDRVSPGGVSLLRARRWHMVLGVRKTLIRYWETQPSQNHGPVSTVMSAREKGSNIHCPWSSLRLYPVLPCRLDPFKLSGSSLRSMSDNSVQGQCYWSAPEAPVPVSSPAFFHPSPSSFFSPPTIPLFSLKLPRECDLIDSV